MAPPRRQQWQMYAIDRKGPAPPREGASSGASSPSPWGMPTSSPTASFHPSPGNGERPQAPTRAPSVVSVSQTASVASGARPGPSASSTVPQRPRPPTQPVLYGEAARMNMPARSGQPAKPPRSVAGTVSTFVPDESGVDGNMFFGEDYTGWYQKYDPKKGSATTTAATAYHGTSKAQILDRQRELARELARQNEVSVVDASRSRQPASSSTVAAPPPMPEINPAITKSLTLEAPNRDIRETWSNITEYLKEAAKLTGAVRPRSQLAAPRESKTANRAELRALIVKAVGAIRMLEKENRRLGGQWKWDSSASPAIQRAAKLISQVEQWDEWTIQLQSNRVKSRAAREQMLLLLAEEGDEGGGGDGTGPDGGIDNMDEDEDTKLLQLNELRANIAELRVCWENLVVANNFLGARGPKARRPKVIIPSDDEDDDVTEKDDDSEDDYIPRNLVEESVIARIGDLLGTSDDED